MAEITNDLRTTTISLDEYNNLRDNIESLRRETGANEETIRHLEDKLSEADDKNREVRVTHYTNNYSPWIGDYSLSVAKVEFVNMADVEILADKKARSEVEAHIDELENKVIEYNNEVKARERTITQLGEDNNVRVEDLKRAYNKDVKAYKETITDLKEEIQKVKDSKTDIEIEKKRNEEIKDLKGRIKDLESTIEELGKLNFFKRTFKLRTISAEKLAAQKELLQRERRANAVGTTWVKEGGKYRKSEFFKDVYASMRGLIYRW